MIEQWVFSRGKMFILDQNVRIIDIFVIYSEHVNLIAFLLKMI